MLVVECQAMPRPRTYDTAAVVAAAADVFWERGYELTSIGDLEARTGLDRSSLYHAFGSKQALFRAALACYLEQNINQRLRGMQHPDAGLASVVGFFAMMAQVFRVQPALASRGCLIVNTVAEVGGREELAIAAGAGYRDRLREAFARALWQAAARGEIDAAHGRERANLLASMTIGLFLTARIDAADAANVCDSVAAEVAAWRVS
jgi:TetR/AcrR family transcriptional regulator, transcriptional repressor for nem operon